MGTFSGNVYFRAFLFFILIFVVVSGSIYAFRKWMPADNGGQPIAFNHRTHVTSAQIECSECHPYFSKGQYSGLPSADVCMTCHADAVTKSPEEAKLRDLVAKGRPVVFRKLFHLPDHVYYSHRRHVVLGKLQCTQCHGEIANTQVPPSRPLIAVTMQYCIDCHTQAKVSNDCKSCHR